MLQFGFMRGETPFEDDPPLTIKSTSEFNPIKRNVLCGSGDNFVEDKTNYYGEVVDMEGLYVTKVCYKRQVPFISFKYITDEADERAHEDWEKILYQGIEEFHKRVITKSIDDDIESMKDEYVDSKLWNGKESFLDDDMIRSGIVIQDNLKLYVMNISYRRLWNVSIRME